MKDNFSSPCIELFAISRITTLVPVHKYYDYTKQHKCNIN